MWKIQPPPLTRNVLPQFEAEMRTTEADGETPHSSQEEASTKEAPRTGERQLLTEFQIPLFSTLHQGILIGKSDGAVSYMQDDASESQEKELTNQSNLIRRSAALQVIEGFERRVRASVPCESGESGSTAFSFCSL